MSKKKKEAIKPIEDTYAFYLRVSTLNQVVEETIENQRIAAEKFIKEMNLDKNKCKFFEDNGESGAIDGEVRISFGKLYSELLENRIYALWVFSTSRLARESSIFAPFLYELRKRNVRLFVSSKEYDLNNPEENLMLTIFAAFDAFERNQISFRTSIGRNKLKDEGKLIVPRLFGYSHEKKDVNVGRRGRKVIEPIPEQLAIMKQVIQAFLEGKNYCQITKIVGFGRPGDWKDKILHPEFYGLTRNSQGLIIKSQLYNSLFSNNEKKNRELYDRVNELAKNAKYKYLSQNHLINDTYEYSGMIECAYCKRKYYHNQQLRIQGKQDNYRVYQHFMIGLITKQEVCNTNTKFLRYHITNKIIDVSYRLFYLLKDVFQQDYFIIKEEKVRKNTINEQINNLKNALNKEETLLAYHLECINNFINYSDLKNHRDNEVKVLKTIDTIKYQLRKLEKSLEEDVVKIKEQDDVFTNLTIKDFKTKTKKEKRELVGKIFHSIKAFKDNVLVVSCFTNAHFIFDCKEDERYKDTPARQSIRDIATMVGQSINFKNTNILNSIVAPKKNIKGETRELISEVSGFPLKVYDFRGFAFSNQIEWDKFFKNSPTSIRITNNTIKPIKVRKARTGRNPATGATIEIRKGFNTSNLDIKSKKYLLELLYPNGNNTLGIKPKNERLEG